MTGRALLLSVAFASMATGQAHVKGQAPDVSIGSKKFTESVVLGEVLHLLAVSAGAKVESHAELGGTRVLWNALERGEIDAYPEYTGTIATEILVDQGIQDLAQLRRAVAAKGVSMSAPLGFNNTYVLGMKESRAEALGVRRISDLRAHPELRFGFSNEFMERTDGWPGLRATYALPQRDVRGMDHDLAYRGLEADSIDVVDLYATDAEIDYYGLRRLEDDRAYFPRYDAVVLYRDDLATRAPAVVEAFALLDGRVSAATMTAMNVEVKLDRQPESKVASSFLRETFGIATTPEPETAWAQFWKHTWEHLFLVLVSLTMAILVAIPLGVFAARHARIGQFVLGGVGIIQTIPALALLVFMIPLLGIGAAPAIAALFLYSLLPIVRNTYAGLHDIPRPIVESAIALGLSPRQRLRLVELPLAARSILAGVKTSAVINVGTATLGALIGTGGYGQPILTGIRLDDVGLIMQGAVPAAGLALLCQGAFELAERKLVSPGLRHRPEQGVP